MNHTVAPVPSSMPTRSLESRLWLGLLLALIVLEIVPLWAFQYIPSQDGPSHLHNAMVLANYGTEPLYQEYYLIKLISPAGNALTQFLLAALVRLTEPHLAERILLSGYMAIFFFAFRYFLRGLTPYADHFSLFAGVLAPNWFFYMGFWNFCFSISFLLLTVGYHARHQQSGTRWALRPLLALTLAGMVVYASHAVSWVVCCMALAVLGLPRLLSGVLERRRISGSFQSKSIIPAVFQYALPLCCLLPPAVFLLTHVVYSQRESACPAEPSLRAKLWPLYSLSFLHTINADTTSAKIMAGAFVVVFLLALIVLFRSRVYNYWSTSLLFLSFSCGVLAVISPDCVGAGSYIHKRLAFYCFLFFIAWIASACPTWPRPALNVVAAICLVAAVISFAARMPLLSRWNEKLSAFVHIGQNIRPRSTILSLCLGRSTQGVDPLRHAAGLLSPKIIIDMSNYEATTDFFTTRFRPEYSPFPALGELPQLESMRPKFDVIRYERQTKGHVDYILLHNDIGDEGPAAESLHEGLIRDQLAAYTLVRSEQSGRLRLYRSKRLGTIESPSENATRSK